MVACLLLWPAYGADEEIAAGVAASAALAAAARRRQSIGLRWCMRMAYCVSSARGGELRACERQAGPGHDERNNHVNVLHLKRAWCLSLPLCQDRSVWSARLAFVCCMRRVSGLDGRRRAVLLRPLCVCFCSSLLRVSSSENEIQKPSVRANDMLMSGVVCAAFAPLTRVGREAARAGVPGPRAASRARTAARRRGRGLGASRDAEAARAEPAARTRRGRGRRTRGAPRCPNYQ